MLLVQPLVGTHGSDLRLHRQRLRNDIPHGSGFPDVASRAHGAEARQENHSRHGVESFEPGGESRGMPPEVVLVMPRIFCDRVRDPLPKLLLVVIGRVVDPQGQRFRSDQVVGGQRGGQRGLLSPVRCDQIEHFLGSQRQQNKPPVRPIRIVCGDGQQSSKDRGDFPVPFTGRCGGCSPPSFARFPRFPFQVFLRPRHQLDGFPVRRKGIVIPRQQTVFPQNHALAPGRRIERGGGVFCQRETGLDIVENDDIAAECIPDDRISVPLVGESQDRVGMGVIDVFRGKERVQQRLDGGSCSPGGKPVRVQLIHHGSVRQRRKGSQPSQVFEIERHMPVRFDACQIMPRCLDEKHRDRLTENVGACRFDRRVAAAAENEFLFLPDQPARVGPESQVSSPALAIPGDPFGGFFIQPFVFHQGSRWVRGFSTSIMNGSYFLVFFSFRYTSYASPGVMFS